MALRNIGIKVNTLALSEINKYSAMSCCAIHGYDSTLNKGDVLTFDGKPYEGQVDLLTHGSPCTSMSLEGKKDGADKGSGTASSLLWESVRVIKECLPKVVVWENVYTVVNKKNIHNFEAYLNDLEELGYVNYHKVYHAIDYDTPQNRKRMVVVSIHKSSGLTFKIPDKLPQTRELKDLLEDNVDSKYDLEKKVVDQLLLSQDEDIHCRIKIKNGTVQGWIWASEYDGIDFNRPESKTRRGRVQSKRSNTLLTSKTLGTYQNGKLRYFTPLEYWRLQGFDDGDFEKSKKVLEDYKAKGNKLDVDTQLYFQAGNSIPVKILEEVFKELYLK